MSQTNEERKQSSSHEPEPEFSGAEHVLIGLSPQYWAHTPLTIQDFCNLGLVGGVNCIVVKKETSTLETGDAVTQNEITTAFVPVSKCTVQGIIVNVQSLSNGSVLYLIDDGTGLVDCLHWIDRDVYSLPSIVASSLNNEDYSCEGNILFRVGDLVRCMGKIKCISVGEVRETVLVHGKLWEVRNGIREVQATIVERATETVGKNMSVNVETEHMLRCIQFRKKADLIYTAANNSKLNGGGINTAPKQTPLVPFSRENNNNNNNNSTCIIEHHVERSSCLDMEPIRNGAHVLELLGPIITARVAQGSDLPSSDDTYGAWRVFGTTCQCVVGYKDALLYCHCQATIEALDPHCIFRDEMLSTLLDMEKEVPLVQSRNTSESKRMLLCKEAHLEFQYKTLVNDKHLAMMAEKVAKQTVPHMTVNSQRLYINTFRALRKDGILYLIDRDADRYTLISKERVLEPYVRRIMSKDSVNLLGRQMLQLDRPPLLMKVPMCRLHYIKKVLLKE